MCVELRCRDCGEHHETGSQALVCDHKRGVHVYKVIWVNQSGQTVGCPLCLAGAQP